MMKFYKQKKRTIAFVFILSMALNSSLFAKAKIDSISVDDRPDDVAVITIG